VIVDSSAVVAILLKKPGWQPLLDHIADADADPAPGIGVPTLVETGIVLAARLGVLGKTLLARFVQETQMRQLGFHTEHWTVAVDAYLRYGKGRHPAALNFGDCLTYAISRIANEPLLCLGDDFTKTDLPLVQS
jgi:ribonuclease VapC